MRGMAQGLANAGYLVVTFDTRGVGRSTKGKSLTGFAEVKDVISVCNWVCQNLNIDKILLVGSSADDLKANTEYTGYTAASNVIQWFWEVVNSFTKEDMARFLKFVTGTSKG